MTKKNYSKYEAKEELVTLSFNHVLLHKKDTKIYQVIFLSLLNNKIGGGQIQIIGGQNASSLVFMLLGALYPPTVLPHTQESGRLDLHQVVSR